MFFGVGVNEHFFTFEVLGYLSVTGIVTITPLGSASKAVLELFIQSTVGGLPVSCKVGRRWHLLCLALD